jgi:hypothetical protein
MASSKKRKLIRYFLLIFWVSVFSWQFFQMNDRGFKASEILSSNELVDFNESQDYLSFHSKLDYSKASILFFPGALVQPSAYAPLAKSIAEKGYSVFIQKIPYRIAITNKMETEALSKAFSFITNSDEAKWIISGHSRGGRMAANYSSKYSQSLSGMILLGTSHPKEKNLTHLKFPVLKISASEDGLASPSEIKKFAQNLPQNTRFEMIKGGNHSQFGYYGFQFGSGSASITREKQQEITQAEILNYLSSF